MIDVAANIRNVLAQIADACVQAERDPESVRLMLVTKTKPVELIRAALATGQTLIGENKVQEVNAKYAALVDLPHETHLIGHLQRNKVKEIIGHISCLQSLDSVKLAHKLQQRLEFEDRCLDVLIQVNTSGESSKFGITPDDFSMLLTEVIACDRLRIRGLMTIGAHTEEREDIRRCFRLLRALQTSARERFGHRANFDELSMGMSGDMALAIAEGSTMVRVGSAIFGAR